jgi:hypothetical protein
MPVMKVIIQTFHIGNVYFTEADLHQVEISVEQYQDLISDADLHPVEK